MKPPSASHPVRRTCLVVGTSYLILGLADPNSGILQLPLQWLLKEHLHFGPEDVAAFFAIALVPWYLKPVAGVISDSFTMLGSRRRFYLIGAAGAAAVSALTLAFAPHTRLALLPLILLIHCALMVISTVTGGVLVEEGQRYGATGRLTSLRSLSESIAALVAGPVGGWLAGAALGASAVVCASLAVTMAVVFTVAVQEPPALVAPRSFREHLGFTAELLRHRDVWVAAGLFCCYQIAPGFQTPLFFHQTDTLHFNPRFLGSLALLSGAGSIIGAFAYAFVCRKMEFRRLFLSAILIGVFMTMSYVAYRSAIAAIVIEFGNGVCATFAFVALLDLIARSIPKRHEALGYALIFSVGNLASSASDIVGSHWFAGGVKFSNLVWLNAGTTALIVLAVPFLPKRLTRNSEDALSGEASHD